MEVKGGELVVWRRTKKGKVEKNRVTLTEKESNGCWAILVAVSPSASAHLSFWLAFEGF